MRLAVAMCCALLAYARASLEHRPRAVFARGVPFEIELRSAARAVRHAPSRSRDRVVRSYAARHLISGALAGIISNTVVAPLDIVRINIVVGDGQASAWQVARGIYKSGGILDFWRVRSWSQPARRSPRRARAPACRVAAGQHGGRHPHGACVRHPFLQLCHLQESNPEAAQPRGRAVLAHADQLACGRRRGHDGHGVMLPSGDRAPPMRLHRPCHCAARGSWQMRFYRCHMAPQVRTRIATAPVASRVNVVAYMQQLVAAEGVFALYRGIVPSLISVGNPAATAVPPPRPRAPCALACPRRAAVPRARRPLQPRRASQETTSIREKTHRSSRKTPTRTAQSPPARRTHPSHPPPPTHPYTPLAAAGDAILRGALRRSAVTHLC